MTKMKIILLCFWLSTIAYSSESKWIGKEAPDFKLTDLNSKSTVSISQLKGKVLILDFWASWCAPCKKTLPVLKSISIDYKDKVQIVTISIDEKLKNAKSFIKRYNLELPVLHDSDQSVVENYKIPEMPTLFLIDTNGIIQYVHVGYSEDYKETLVKNLNKIL